MTAPWWKVRASWREMRHLEGRGCPRDEVPVPAISLPHTPLPRPGMELLLLGILGSVEWARGGHCSTLPVQESRAVCLVRELAWSRALFESPP